MSAHSPGPWTRPVGSVVADANGNRVADVVRWPDGDKDGLHEANARLIAAAPALAAALAELERQVTADSWGPGLRSLPVRMQRAMVAARAALAQVVRS